MGHRGGDPALIIQPHRFPPPNHIADRIARQPDLLPIGFDRVLARDLDRDIGIRPVRRHLAQLRRTPMRVPIPQHHHLDRKRRVPVHRKELLRKRLPGRHKMRVHAERPVALAVDLELQRRQVRLHAQRRRQGHARVPLGVLEVRLQNPVPQFVGLLAHRKLQKVKRQLAVLLRAQEPPKQHQNRQPSHQASASFQIFSCCEASKCPGNGRPGNTKCSSHRGS